MGFVLVRPCFRAVEGVQGGDDLVGLAEFGGEGGLGVLVLVVVLEGGLDEQVAGLGGDVFVQGAASDVFEYLKRLV